MSAKARNFRRRGGYDGDEEEAPTTKTATNGTAAKPKTPVPTTTATKPKKKTLLSFADDEEDSGESPFITPSSRPSRITKPSSSSSSSAHKLTSGKDRIAPKKPSITSNVQPQAGTYTKEALLELQKNTRTLASSRSSGPKPGPKPGPVEPVIVLKGLVKPVSVSSTQRAEAEEKGQESEEDNEVGVDQYDAKTIEAIRAKRERLREAGPAARDYIALDEGGNHGEAEGLSDEEPEFQRRIGFFGEKTDSGRKGVFEDFDTNDNEDDEEDKMWEEEQVRKGLGKRLDDGGSNRGVMSSSVTSATAAVQKVNLGTSAAGASSVYYSSVQSIGVSVGGPTIGGGVVGGLPSLDALSISKQAEVAKNALYESMGRLKESHGRTMASLNKTEENLSASLSNVTTLENSLSAAGEKYMFMQKLRDFVSVICTLLQDKAPYIEELEDQMQKLHEERAEATLERRAADNDDEMRELEAAVNAARQVLSKGGSNAATIEAATAAAQAATASMRKGGDLPAELDEFGRDVNLQKRMDTTRRAEARKLRRVRNDVKRMSAIERDSSYHKIEGESSTDESDSESTAYESNRDQLLQVAEQIFGDAHEEYSQLSLVVEKFDRWKKDYASSYRDAYMSLSIPAIFSPYVRLELLKWDPLHENADFMDMNWHSLLFNYGLPEGESEISTDDADANLIPQLVEKLVVPILHNQLANCWDMLSTSETDCAVSAMKLVLRYGPFSGSALSNLVAVLRDRLADAVANLKVPTWDTLVMRAVPDAARVAAYRFGMSIRLMRNICLFHEIFAMPVLEELVLDQLFSGKILPHLRSIQSNIHDAVTRTERVVASVRGVWAGPKVTGDCSPKLRPLVDYLLKLGRVLEKKHSSSSGEIDTSKFARRLKKMLVELNQYDYARDISRTFNIKEAL
ncbi:transcriptional repressor ILP1-like [Nicotiana tabacum]|uniref:PAX3- and PAX7-binding protein 1-like isoform X1 n=2 Tax=Nicotiana TaxID=4085 RepID=A0A1S4A4Q1_TOBAC|nr:PREDICTED: PAX3- and PAX7-binding protein 1 [Nicotiana sylvestris]XP_016471618.1 PREDICTED: PAX3- and PAX7-binding protein 1-like isoform X1 [Nicotiana tabacum]XP_016471619.1 PREDICTED: PAX3- and PAX7-binding protein 1-like isoform X2 [Nicotiana tabacum]